MTEARVREYRRWAAKNGGSFGEWHAEHMKTKELPREVVLAIKHLNTAREAASVAVVSAQHVGEPWSTIAAWMIRAGGKLLLLSASSYSRRTLRPKDNPMRFAFMLMLMMLLPALAFAQASLPVDLPVDQAVGMLLQSLGGMKGTGALAIAVLVTQGIMLFFRTPLATFAGKWKLLIVAGLSLLTGFLGLIAVGVDWKVALMHANTIGALQVFGHQVFIQFTEKPAEV